MEHRPDFTPAFSCDHPAFWAGDLETINTALGRVAKGEVRCIATSPGGRPIHLVAYNDKEPFLSRANFNSAVGAGDPTAYADKGKRTRPVVLILGPVHGNETNGSTGCVNMMQVMETGADLRGQPWPELAELGWSCRTLIIPVANPDGLARFRPGCAVGCEEYEMVYWAQGTDREGRLWEWPGFKARHPMRPEHGEALGGNLNDAGVNPMHDEFFAPMGPEAPAILGLARDKAPEIIAGLHAHPTAPAILQPAHVPMYVKREAATLARRLKEAYRQAGLAYAEPFTPEPDGEQPPGQPFNLTSALFHTSGALSFTFECPCGMDAEGALPCTHEEMLDMQLILYQECFRFAHERLRAWPGAVAAK